MSKGDEEARNILIERNLRLVAHVAKKYSNSKVDQEDLISIGTVGLIKGINSFNISNVINNKEMFEECCELKNVDLNKFNILNKNNGLINLKNTNEINNLNKDNQDDLKEKLKKLITIHLTSSDQKIDYSTSCYNTDLFSTIEQKLILQFAKLKILSL